MYKLYLTCQQALVCFLAGSPAHHPSTNQEVGRASASRLPDTAEPPPRALLNLKGLVIITA